MSNQSNFLDPVRFGNFQLDLHTAELRRGNTLIKLQPQPAKVLVLLVRRAGETISRQELADQVWGTDTFVDFEQGLNFAIRQIRAALEDERGSPLFIETVPKKGYRFIAPVENGFKPNAEVPTPEDNIDRADESRGDGKRGSSLGRGRFLIGTIVLFLISIVGSFGYRYLARRSNSRSIHSLAVLPLANLSSDADQEYFSEGLTDELITDLARIGGLRVISRTSIVGYRSTSKRTPAIAQELGVDGIVEGTVERDHGRIRIRVQMINARTDEHFWASSYDGDGNDALRLEADVASDVAQQIGHRLTEKANQSRGPAIPAPVYDEYLRGRYYWNKRTSEGVTKAIAQFEQVIQQAPRFAPAYSGLADCYNLLTIYDDATPTETFPKAKDAAMKALELNPNLGSAHASLAEVYFRFDWDWEAAEKEFRRAIELEPGYSTAHHWYAEYLVAMGRFKQGIAETEKALELDPLSLIINADAGWFFEMAGENDRALLQLRRTLELEPRFAPAHLYLGEVYLRKEMYSEAIAAYRESANLSDYGYSAPLGYAYGRAGKRAEARIVIDELRGRPKMSPTSIAIVYAGLGDKDRAFALLERALREHDDSLIYIRSQILFDPLRSDARFKALLRKMAFPT